jgi:hypothetical protein
MSDQKEELKIKTEESVEIEEKKIEIEEKKKVDNNDDIFITENDKFTLSVKYYLEGKEPIVKGFSDNYNDRNKEVHAFDVYFKYPSQKDAEYIMSVKPIQSMEEAKVLDFIELENVRLMVLFRGWSMNRPKEDLANIHPTIIKALRAKMSDEIAGNGLF